MLFDLRGSGRRRTIKVIYLFLAVLMAVGLIGFGIGGATSGGWVDSLFGGGGGSSSNNDVFQKRVDANVAKLKIHPNDQAALAALVTARYQLAQELAADPDKAQESNAQLNLASRTWDRYLKLNPDPVNDSAARTAVNVFAVLEKPADAATAQELVIDASGDAATYQQYATLFTYAFAAGQTRKADLAYDKAIELAPSKDSRAAIKAQMDGVKNQASGTSTTPTTTDSATGE
jgi:tetratricopeptide (TPR) repeat protein